jgi:D-arabinose 1-dehydrogenase-like Zn-dependent alcohol dehydrogenase
MIKSLAVFPSSREVRLIDLPEPTIAKPTEVKLRILEAGICGTDREITSSQCGTPPVGSPYLVIGHEAVGEVVDAGNGVFIFTGVPGVRAPIEIDAERIMRNLVLNNQVLCGTVNAGRASFWEGVRDLGSFMQRFLAAVRALITDRVLLDEARDAVLTRGGIKSVIKIA